MRDRRLLVTAIVLIVIGMIGLFGIERHVSHKRVVERHGMRDMMMDGMMDRQQMKGMMKQMMPGLLPPGVRPENLPDHEGKGAKLMGRYCGQCHDLPSPAMHSAQEWPAVAGRMFARIMMMADMMDIENPSDEEQEAIVSYLKTNAMRSIAPGALPMPSSRGAVLFKDICSRCHSLPDPKLHTAGEWPIVVDRMMKNVISMGRKAPSEAEKTDIVQYLVSHARK